MLHNEGAEATTPPPPQSPHDYRSPSKAPMPATAMPVYADSSDDEDYYNEDGRSSPPDSPSGSRFAAFFAGRGYF